MISAPFSCRRRPGITLLEVVIALAIFLFSLTALIQLLSSGSERALTASLRSQAGLRCQSKLAEVVAGIEPLRSDGYAAFAEDPDWQWRLECSQADLPNLWNVQVWVKRDRPSGGAIEVSLSQMILDPGTRGSTLDAAPTQPADAGGAAK
jgi:type II secretion system protein I